MSSDPITVLVTCGGGFQGIGILGGLKPAGARVVLTDHNDNNVGRYLAHRFYRVSPCKDEDVLLGQLLSICEHEQVDVVIPATPYDLTLISTHWEMFESCGARVAVSRPECLKLLLGKWALYKWLSQEHLPVLPVLTEFDEDACFPVIGKPDQGWGGKHNLIAQCVDQLPAEIAGFVWQPYLEEFVEYSVDFVVPFGDAEPSWAIRRRTKTTAGFSVIADRHDCLALEDVCGTLVGRIKLSG